MQNGRSPLFLSLFFSSVDLFFTNVRHSRLFVVIESMRSFYLRPPLQETLTIDGYFDDMLISIKLLEQSCNLPGNACCHGELNENNKQAIYRFFLYNSLQCIINTKIKKNVIEQVLASLPNLQRNYNHNHRYNKGRSCVALLYSQCCLLSRMFFYLFASTAAHLDRIIYCRRVKAVYLTTYKEKQVLIRFRDVASD